MARTAPIAVFIPTYRRGGAVLKVLERLEQCDPRPSEIWVHVDNANGELEKTINRRFPNVNLLTSTKRLGPGGGRHRCLMACNAPYAASFDDDSYPMDLDYFAVVQQLLNEGPQIAILGASVWHRNEPAKARNDALTPSPSYIGCGYAIRVSAYKSVRGYLPRPISYGMEETDLSLRLFAAGWEIHEAGALRVLHDTELKHHKCKEITAGSIINVGLYIFLNYPIEGWGRGLAQVVNKVVFFMQMGRLRGICSGLVRIPIECYRNRHYRKPIPWSAIQRYLRFCRTGVLTSGDTRLTRDKLLLLL